MPTFWLRGRSKSPPSGVWTSLLPVLPRLRYPFWSSLTFSVQALLQSCVVFETLTVQYQLYIYQYHVMLLDSVTHVLMTSDYKIRLNAPTYLLTYFWDTVSCRWPADGRVWPVGIHDNTQLGRTVSRCLAAWTSRQSERMWVVLLHDIFTPAVKLLADHEVNRYTSVWIIIIIIIIYVTFIIGFGSQETWIIIITKLSREK